MSVKHVSPVVMFLSLWMLFSAAHGESIPDETLLKCAVYYEMLATTGDLKDISSKDSSKAFYAFQKKLSSGKQQSTVVDMIAERMGTMRAEIPGRMSETSISDFRKKYDPECRALLFDVWCEAFGEIDKNACKR